MSYSLVEKTLTKPRQPPVFTGRYTLSCPLTGWLHVATADGMDPSIYCDWGFSHIFTGCYHHISMKYETLWLLCLHISGVLWDYGTRVYTMTASLLQCLVPNARTLCASWSVANVMLLTACTHQKNIEAKHEVYNRDNWELLSTVMSSHYDDWWMYCVWIMPSHHERGMWMVSVCWRLLLFDFILQQMMMCDDGVKVSVITE